MAVTIPNDGTIGREVYTTLCQFNHNYCGMIFKIGGRWETYNGVSTRNEVRDRSTCFTFPLYQSGTTPHSLIGGSMQRLIPRSQC